MRAGPAIAGLLLALPALALAQAAAPAPSGATDAPPPAAAAPAGRVTKLPVLKRFVEAPYPPAAEQARVEGAVLLEIDIGADGRIARAAVLQGAGHGFDEAALEAVRQFEFEPAELDFQPAPVRLTYRYEFVLRAAPPAPAAPAGVVALEGRVLERGTRSPIANATVRAALGEAAAETSTDERGRFALKNLAPGTWKIGVYEARHEKFETQEEVRAGEVVEATYYVRARGGGLEATVRAQRERKEVARRTLVLQEIQKIPGTQGDAIRIVQNLPGVARTPVGLGPVMVRGGRPGDTRTYIDGQLVPLLFHFGGLTSVINSDFLETLDFFPGNLPVRYGRSIAGAVDVNTRAGRSDRWHGYANLNLTESTLFAEGPVPGGALMVSVRRSYIDAVLPVVFAIGGWQDAVKFSLAPRYWDYQLKGDFKVGKDELSLFVFGSDDRLAAALPAGTAAAASVEDYGAASFAMGFHRLTAKWRRPLAPGWDHRLVATLGVDSTESALGSDVSLGAGLRSLALREEIGWQQAPRLKWQAGLDLVFAHYDYALVGPLSPPPGEFFDPRVQGNTVRASDAGWAAQPGLYLEAVATPVDGLKLVPGLRADWDSMLRRGWVDPRLTAFWDLAGGRVVLKAAAGWHHQPPTPDKLLEKFGNPGLREEGSRQVAAGVEWRIDELNGVDVQFYYKDMYDEAQWTAGTIVSADGGVVPRNYDNSGRGRGYGVELLVRRDPGKRLFGWVALSLGRTDRKVAETGAWAPSYVDQRYNLVAVATYRLPAGFEIGARTRLTEGNPRTAIVGSVYDSDADFHLPLPSTTRRDLRASPFFQVDVRLDRRWTFERWILDVYLEVQNVTNRWNEEGDNYNYDFTQRVPLVGLPIFPFFGVRGEY